MDVRFGKFWILSNGLIVIDKKGNRHFVSDALKNAMGFEIVQNTINIEQIADDYQDNWLGGIINRHGNWQKGTLYGTNLREDNAVGQDFISCSKNQVGGYTGFFGSLTKFKVTREGTVIVFLVWEGNRDPYLSFIHNEIRPYLTIPEED